MKTQRPTQKSDFLDFIDLREIKNFFVPGSEVAWAHYNNLKKDFPFLKDCQESEIDQWIIQNFSYISEYQLSLNNIRNTPIPVTEKIKLSYRQRSYLGEYGEQQGRGDSMPVLDLEGAPAGFVDRKGAGVSLNKLQENHILLNWAKKNNKLNDFESFQVSNGLLLFGEGILEAIKMEVAQECYRLLNHFGRYQEANKSRGDHPLHMIEPYFLILFPFFVNGGNGKKIPTGLFGRQAHIGRIWAGPVFSKELTLKQSDFFTANVDTGSAHFRLPELKNSLASLRGFPDFSIYETCTDLADQYLAGDRNIIKNKIDLFLEPIQEKLNQCSNLDNEIETPEQSFIKILDLLEQSPEVFYRYSYVIYSMALQKSSLVVKYQKRIEKCCLSLLNLSPNEFEVESPGLPKRRWGLLLIPLLSEPKKSKKWQEEVAKAYYGCEQLGQAVLLMPYDLVKKYWTPLKLKAGQWIWIEVMGRKEEDQLDQLEFGKELELHCQTIPYFLRNRSPFVRSKKEALIRSLPRFRKTKRYWT